MRAVAIVAAVVLSVSGIRAEMPPRLVIRLYDSAAVPGIQLDRAAAEAEAIVGGSLNVAIRRCPCAEPLTPEEVVVRVITAPPFHASLHPDALGLTYILKGTDRGWLATVFADRVQQVAERADVDPATLLGRAIAHEVGHLLLGRGYHGGDGVMRARWTDALLAHAEDEWQFSPIETSRMQLAVTRMTDKSAP